MLSGFLSVYYKNCNYLLVCGLHKQTNNNLMTLLFGSVCYSIEKCRHSLEMVVKSHNALTQPVGRSVSRPVSHSINDERLRVRTFCFSIVIYSSIDLQVATLISISSLLIFFPFNIYIYLYRFCFLSISFVVIIIRFRCMPV